METPTIYQRPVQSLIIDDEADLCYLLGNLLEQKHIDNDFAISLKEGKQKLKMKKFDLIFLDNYLPDGKGIDFVPFIRSLMPQTFIIMFSAYMETSIIKEINKKGIDYFLSKPLLADQINSILDEFLKNNSPLSTRKYPLENFMILFNYGDKEYTAKVTKCKSGNTTNYTVYPTALFIIKKFGGKLNLSKEDGSYSVNTSNDGPYKAYVDTLTNAIRNQERSGL